MANKNRFLGVPLSSSHQSRQAPAPGITCRGPASERRSRIFARGSLQPRFQAHRRGDALQVPQPCRRTSGGGRGGDQPCDPESRSLALYAQRCERVEVAVFESELGFEAVEIAADGDDCQRLAAGPERHRAVALVDVTGDVGAVPALGMTHVGNRDVVVLAPEEGDDLAGDLLASMFLAAIWPRRSATTQCSTRIGWPE